MRKNKQPPQVTAYPLRLQSPSLADLSRYPYGIWIDAVLAEVLPGLRWELHDPVLAARVGPGIVVLLYVVSSTEIRAELAREIDGEPLHSFQYSLASFSAASFFQWFRAVATFIEQATEEIDRGLYGALPLDAPTLRLSWPQVGQGFPLACARRGIRRPTSRIFEDFASLSRDGSLWPLCGLCVVVGPCAAANTRTAALLARADQAAAKSRPLYVFRPPSMDAVRGAAGDLLEKVLSKLCLCPDEEDPAEFLRGVLHGESQTVIADLGAVLCPENPAPWRDQAALLGRDPTNHVLFLRSDLDPESSCELITQAIGNVARIYWVESAGRLCPLYGSVQSGIHGSSLPCGVIFPPFA